MARYDAERVKTTLGRKLFGRLIFAGERLNLVLVWGSFEKKKKKKKKMSIWRGRDSSDIRCSGKIGKSRWHFIRTRWLIFYSKWTKLKWCVLAKWNIEIALSTLYYFRPTNEISFRTYSYFRSHVLISSFFSFFATVVRGKRTKFFKRKNIAKRSVIKKKKKHTNGMRFSFRFNNPKMNVTRKRKKNIQKKKGAIFLFSPYYI